VFRNYFLINLILVIIIGLLGFKFYKVLARPLDIPASVAQQQIQPDKKDVAGEKKADLDTSVYQVIVLKDLFRPSRSAPKAEGTSAESFLRETPKLFGTIIMGDEKSAILEDPFTKITRLYRINDSFAGFIISDIQKDKIVLSKEDKSIEVKLREIKTIVLPPQQRPQMRPQMPRGDLQRPSRPRQRPVPREVAQPPPAEATATEGEREQPFVGEEVEGEGEREDVKNIE
jgi:hypothetical protein